MCIIKELIHRIDVTEAQWLIIAVEMVSFVCGVDIWRVVVRGCGQSCQHGDYHNVIGFWGI